MSAAHKNYIAGEWVDGVAAPATSTRRTPTTSIGDYAQPTPPRPARRSLRRKPPSRPGRARRRSSATTSSCASSTEILARKEELGRLLSREEGKTLPEGIGESTRAGQIFDFFAGEALRIPGEKFAIVRPDVDIEATREPWAWSASSRHGISRSPSRPGRSRRRSPTATRWSSSRPIWCPARPTLAESSCAPASRRACSTS